MSTADDVKKLVGSMSHAQGSSLYRKRDLPFVTISRQSGAGGHTLAKALIELMEKEKDKEIFQGWQICDQSLCELIMQDSQLNVSMKSLLAEEYHSKIEEFVLGLLGKRTDQALVMRKLFETIRALAMVGKVIIVGRGGSQVAKGLGIGIHVRLIAPEPVRVRHMSKLLGLSEEEARKAVQKQDRDRARLLKESFYIDIDDPLQYDVTWNTNTVSSEAIAQGIVSVIKYRVAERSSTPRTGK